MAMDFKDLQALQSKMSGAQIQQLEIACAKELGARLLRDVVKNTPVGIYPKESGKQGGTLRRAWRVMSPKLKQGGCTLDVTNPTVYASYVEYGHRQEPGRYVPAIGKRLKASWVNGKFMLTNAESRLQRQAQAIVDKKVQKYWEDMLNGK